MPRFRLIHLLVFIIAAGVTLALLARPSVYWLVAMPALMTALCVFGVFRAVVSTNERPLWTSFIAGLFGYGAIVMFIRSTFWYERSSWGGDKDVWQVILVEPLWRLIHGEIPYGSIINGVSEREFYSFLISLHLIIAVVISLLCMLAACHLSRKFNRGS